MEGFEQDYHNFSTSSSHRLPTVSGTQAIRNAIQNSRPIPTSLASLDAILASGLNASTLQKGLQRGLVTEIYGPPGVGKTTFALQLAVNALHDGSSVTWIDTSSALVFSRLRQLMNAYRLPPGRDSPSSPLQPGRSKEALLMAEKFNYMQITTLPKLLTLFMHSAGNFPLPNTSLIVLDDLSNLILASLPRISGRADKAVQSTPAAIRNDAAAKQVASRRFQILSNFAFSLQKYAAAHNVALVVLSKATVNLKTGQKAVLRPALTSQQWDNYLSARIALFRDFWPEDSDFAKVKAENATNENFNEMESRSLRIAKIVRLSGKLVSTPDICFVIEEGGLREIGTSAIQNEVPVLPLATQPLPNFEELVEDGINEAAAPDDVEPAETPEPTEDHVEADISNPQEKSKRKAIEIADSEDEDDLDADGEPTLPPIVTQNCTFRCSQIEQSGFQTAKKLRANGTVAFVIDENEHDGGEHNPDGDDEEEMLLDQHERELPRFSQAAADLSEPLTPSDDCRGSP